jgi:YHS domain-containing protein
MILESQGRCRRFSGVPLLLALAAMVCGSTAGRGAEPESIAWRDDYGIALEEARSANRFLWIQFTGPWCPNCTRMERDAFAQPAIIQHSQRSFVPLKLRSDVHEQLALRFNLSGIPATIIVTPKGDIVAVHQGFLGAAEFDEFLRDCLAPRGAKSAGSSVAEKRAGSPVRASNRHAEPQQEPALALSGYCAVSLICDRKLVKGQADCAVQHEGRIYRFASLAMSDRFRKEPERFLPVNNGACPVTQVERGVTKPGNPRWGVLYGGRLVLCATEDDRLRFLKNPEPYAMVDVAEGGYCVHCRRESGLLIRGDPRHEVARLGLRYWFPDSTHRDAFLATPR